MTQRRESPRTEGSSRAASLVRARALPASVTDLFRLLAARRLSTAVARAVHVVRRTSRATRRQHCCCPKQELQRRRAERRFVGDACRCNRYEGRRLLIDPSQNDCPGLPEQDAYLTILRQAFAGFGEGPSLQLDFGATSGDVFGSADAGGSRFSVARHLPPVYSVGRRARAEPSRARGNRPAGPARGPVVAGTRGRRPLRSGRVPLERRRCEPVASRRRPDW
jgi:hypothetical protein